MTQANNLRYKDIAKVMPLAKTTFDKLKKEVDMYEVYEVLRTNADLYEKKHYVYALKLKRSHQDLIWDAYNRRGEPRKTYKRRAKV